jgi:hypothetical protein
MIPQTSTNKTTLTTKSRSLSMPCAHYGAYRKPSSPPSPPFPCTSTTPMPSQQQPSSPITPTNVNSLAGLPLTVLPAPARTAITIPPRALSHLHAFSPGPPDPRAGKVRQMHQQAILRRSSRVFLVRGPRPARTVSSHLLTPPLPNLPPS